MQKPKWNNITVRLGDLKPWMENPRLSTKAQAQRIIKSFEKFGQVITVAVDPDLEVLDGHQRLSALLTLHGENYEIDARQSSRKLTIEERKELVINLHVGAVGQWDWERIANSWAAGDLQEWGMDGDALKGWNNDALNLRMLTTAEIDEAAAFSALPDQDRAPFQQMTFTLHDDQAETVREAMKVAKAMGAFIDTGNENSNGNALARICELFIGEHGNGEGH